jgi:hypothetical protein
MRATDIARCTVDDLFDQYALLHISYSTCQKGMCHRTVLACPKWAMRGERLMVHEGTGSRGFQKFSKNLRLMEQRACQCFCFHSFPLHSQNSLLLQHISLKTCNTCPSFSPEIPLHSLCLRHQILSGKKERSHQSWIQRMLRVNVS